MFSGRASAVTRHSKTAGIHRAFQAYTDRHAESKCNLGSPTEFMSASLSGSDSHGLERRRHRKKLLRVVVGLLAKKWHTGSMVLVALKHEHRQCQGGDARFGGHGRAGGVA